MAYRRCVSVEVDCSPTATLSGAAHVLYTLNRVVDDLCLELHRGGSGLRDDSLPMPPYLGRSQELRFHMGAFLISAVEHSLPVDAGMHGIRESILDGSVSEGAMFEEPARLSNGTAGPAIDLRSTDDSWNQYNLLSLGSMLPLPS